MAQETEYKLRKVQFTKALRGYACEEVDTYLAYVYDRYATLSKECSDLKKKMAVMAAGQNEFREDALREKDKIAAEADALVKEKEQAAGKLMEDARRKAAGLLAEAEAAAARILKQAEDEAGEIRLKQREADETALQNADRMIAERNNAADRLVEEIDSFREEIFAMYARHIEELERLAQRTDAFYQTKEEITEAFAGDTDADVEVLPDDNGETEDDGELYMPAEAVAEDAAEPEEDMEVFAGEAEGGDDVWTDPDAESEEAQEDLLRIDWKKHRAGRENTESENMAEKTLWEIADEAADASRWETDADDGIPETEMAAVSEEDDEPELYEAADTDGEFDLLTEEEYEEPDGEDAVSAEAFSEEDFLSDIASEYIVPSRKQAAKPVQEEKKQPVQKTPADTRTGRKKEPADLDELFYEEEARNVSLTGEFDIIFNSQKSGANVTQISRQPLVEAQKPEKPKKHSTK